jgi:hypothetical protein
LENSESIFGRFWLGFSVLALGGGESIFGRFWLGFSVLPLGGGEDSIGPEMNPLDPGINEMPNKYELNLNQNTVGLKELNLE